MSRDERKVGLEAVGITDPAKVHWNLSVAALYEEAVRRGEGVISATARSSAAPASTPAVRRTTSSSSRSPRARSNVAWGKVNRPIDAASVRRTARRACWRTCGQGAVRARTAGPAPIRRTGCRFASSPSARGTACSRGTCSFPRPIREARCDHEPQFTVIDVPGFTADPANDKTNSETFILLNFAKKLVIIGGTNYAGEIKKSIFTVMNYLLPLRDVMPMHCSANVGEDGDVALFFGLSGTGKTTLSSDPNRG